MKHNLQKPSQNKGMKKMMIAAALVFAAAACLGNAAPEQEPFKAVYVCEAESGSEVAAFNGNKHLPIASMCKVMTLLLAFEAVDAGELSLEEEIVVSERAAGMGGSQVFLDAGLSYPAGELLKSIAVCSANDSCVAVSERLAGSEEAFVARMNERARELGAADTLFANCTGLPREPQYSCAKDVALMLRELIKHETFFSYAGVRLEDFHHPDGRVTTMTNTNKLLRKLEGCDGGKTGFTEEAGFCLAATAKRNNTRLVCVVIGADSSDDRFDAVSRLLNETFAGYERKIAAAAGEAVGQGVAVKGSAVRELAVAPERSLGVFQKKGDRAEMRTELILPDAVKAPLMKGDRVGEIVLMKDGVEIDRCALVSLGNAARYSYGEAFREGARLWN